VKVSIIIPTYKRGEKFIKRALDSLLCQTYEDIEIVLVDDNAKPEHLQFRQTVESVVEEYKSEKIKYIQNAENLGGALARNEGIKVASGSYITFLDDDDRYLPEKVEKQLAFMLENGLDMSFTDLKIHNEEDKLIDYREYSKIKSYDNDYLLRYHLTRQIVGTNTFMYKKDALIGIGCFVKVSMGQEYYLMHNTIKAGLKIGCIHEAQTVLYREGHECISSGTNKINGEKKLFEFKKQNFSYLNRKERTYVEFRHRCVMAVAYKRNNQILKTLTEIMSAFLTSPANAIAEFFGFFSRRKTSAKE
jgi:glycosyltransferase involved in cell wall biosynthesis